MSESACSRAALLERLFAGRGEIRALGRATDWSLTPLGPVEAWPQSLRSTVRLLLSSQYPMVLTWGPQFTQIYNDAYSKLIGDRHPAGLGADIRVTLAEAWDTLGPMIEHVMVTGEANWTPALPLEMHRAGYREEAYFSVSHAPAENDDGDIVGMLAVCSEVTDQIVSERRLQLLGQMAVAAGDAWQTVEAVSRLVSTVAQSPLDIPYAMLYLLSEDELSLAASQGLTDGSLSAEMLRPFKAEFDPWGLRAAMSGATTICQDAFEWIPVCGGAYQDPVMTTITLPLIGTQGRVVGALVCGVSPNRTLDESYRSFFELLAGQVSVGIRNAQSREEERRRAQELAELDQAKTAFFSNVSHEFRTPLTLILGPLEEALGNLPQSAAAHQDGLEIARRNAMRLLRLVNTLLDFSRVEAHRMAASLEPLNIAELTADLCSNFRAAIEKAGLRFVVDLPNLSGIVLVDQEMYEKVVLNLLSNAFKFTHDGEIRVHLEEARGSEVILTVTDTGAGIPKKELAKIFDRFYRIHGQRARSHEGSGIGLALVKELVELQGGRIAVDSKGEGLGTKFTVTLPNANARRDLTPKNSLPAETARHASTYVQEALRWLPDPTEPEELRGDRPQILVADDNADMRAYIGRLLASEYEVRFVIDGEQALRAAKANPPDLLLSDIMMPRLDGFALLRAIRTDPALAATPVIFLSARAGEDARVASLEAGADDHLIKPFNALELRARIAGALDRARSRGEHAARERVIQAHDEALRARAALEKTEQDLHALADALPVLISHVGPDLRYRFVNRAYEKWLGRPLSEIVGARVEDMIGTQALDHVRPQLEAALKGVAVQFETFIPYSNVRPRHVRVDYVPRQTGNGAVDGFYALVQDITERKLAERHRELLVDELNHRVKNTLAVVQSIAAQSFKGERNPAEERAAFEGRLLALSEAHNLLTRESWDYALLDDVIAGSTRAFGSEAKFRKSGPRVALMPKAAVSIALALHELCTNAAKYGALSTEHGTVDITWTVQDSVTQNAPAFQMSWSETGGPQVLPPRSRGFGSRLVERGLAAELGGTAEMTFPATGLRCVITAPLANMGDKNDPQG